MSVTSKYITRNKGFLGYIGSSSAIAEAKLLYLFSSNSPLKCHFMLTNLPWLTIAYKTAVHEA